MVESNFDKAFATNIIYVATIDVDTHRDCVKIGKTSTTKQSPTHTDLVDAARERTNEYSKTLGIKVNLEHVEEAVRVNSEGCLESFMDHDVHNVLKRSNIKKKHFGTGANEWYQCDVSTAKKAISAVKDYKTSLLPEGKDDWRPIELRPSQEEAIKKTIERFSNHKTMLWNAKMRFGKTVTAYELIKKLNLNRTLIITHRPVVLNGWNEDFYKVFGDSLDHYAFGSKNIGERFEKLEERASSEKHHYVYFASIQDLRGSSDVGGTFDKNNQIFSTNWDLLIIDEAHEGTLTPRGEKVAEALIKDNTYVLRLSGTPYKQMEYVDDAEIYSWDYQMEQRAKNQWDKDYPDIPNPYASLPTINIYTYDLGRLMDLTEVEGMAFNFKEFFRTDGDYDRFVHESDVRRFLQLLYSDEHGNLYPFSCKEYLDTFRHTLWKLPGVKEARALSKLLSEIDFYKENFKVVNVAGDGDEEEEREEALAKLNNAITNHPEKTRTITLSCGRLTTGVTVPAWTGVFMLSGSSKAAATNYMQTIFRVQSPGNIGGRMKEQCYVFDFAPDRTLQVVSEVNHLQNIKKNGTTESDRERLKEFLNFCPIISMEGSHFKKYDVDRMFLQLKRVFIERAVQKGFDDEMIYNNANLKNLSPEEQKMFEQLSKIISKTSAMEKPKGLKLNEHGLTNEEYSKAEQAQERKKKERTPEEEALVALLKEQKKNREAAISILRGISVRMPLLIYGAEIKSELEELTLDNFVNLVDDQSWSVFMPKGVTKEMFQLFNKYFDQDVFTASAIRYRQMTREADMYNIEDRIEHITTILSYFKNPDKETVLTPWKVVNMHLNDTLGGYTFYDEDFEETMTVPRYIDKGEVTKEVFSNKTKILEINSKTGLYPLYAAYNVYRARRKEWEEKNGNRMTFNEQQDLWASVLKENIFVICMSPLAVEITKRTLAGFNDFEVNAVYYEDLINQAKENPQEVTSNIKNAKEFWNINQVENMKFNAVVGNPPYQVMDGGTDRGAVPVYQNFVNIADALRPRYISMIMPARWYAGGRGLDDFRAKMLSDKRIVRLFDFPRCRDVFPNVDIAGGLCYFLIDPSHNGQCEFISREGSESDRAMRKLDEFDILIRSNIGLHIVHKIREKEERSIKSNVLKVSPFGLRSFVRGKETASSSSDVTVITSGGKGFISREDVTKNQDKIDDFKVMIGYLNPDRAGVNNSKDGSNVTTKITILNPGEVVTETYIIIGCFKNKTESENYAKYAKTKFARLLVFLTLSSMHITEVNYQFVPLQDFTQQSDIDWSKPIPEIDQQLYDKYNLTEAERTFIEKMIKSME